MNARSSKSRFCKAWSVGTLVVVVGCTALSGCQRSEAVDDRSPRQKLEDEFAGCPPLLPLDAAKGGWQLAPPAKYRVLGSGDLIMIRASGSDDVTYDITLAAVQPDAPLVGSSPSTKPATRQPAQSGGAPVVFLYRRPPASRLSGVQNDFQICGHLRTSGPVNYVTIRDAGGSHSLAVEPADRPR